MPDSLRRFLSQKTFAFALTLAVVLLIAEAIEQPSFFDPGNAAQELATLAPFAIVAMASTPAILSGGGGLDLSIGPLATLINCIFVTWLLPHGLGGAVSIPIVLAIGAGIGAVNGVLVAVLRYQPVIATLCVFFILAGLAEKIAPTPTPAAANWTAHLGGDVGPIPGALLTIAFPILVWALLRRTAFHRLLMAVGGDDAAAFSAGVDVARIRIVAYALGGLFAAAGGMALTALLQTSSAALSTEYALIALAGVALGGTPIGGGRGGMIGSLLGAVCIFMLQQFLSSAGVSSDYLQLVYGVVLVVGIVLSTRYRSIGRRVAA
ncbi:MAG TPA: ABC transporter permease [Solirubrobacteraceae bacterium]